LADENILGSSHSDFFKQSGSSVSLGKAPSFSDFLKQTGIKISGLNEFLKGIEGQVSFQAEKSPFDQLSKIFNL